MNNKEDINHIKRFLGHNFSEKDARQVIEDIQQDKNTDTLEKYLRDKWLISSEFENTQGQEKEYYEESVRLLQRLTRKKTFLQRSRRLITVAASVLLLFSVGFGYFNYLIPDKAIVISYKSESTTTGQKKRVTLPDGTTVILNACSQIEYPEFFSKENRQVKLTGQAFFNVARNEDKPFIVHTDRFDVKVLGTQFDVKAYREDEILSVNVESGKVQVDMPEAMTRLAANEKLIINTRNKSHHKETENSKVAVWRTGNLLFSKTPVREVAKELERIYTCTIIFKEGQSFDNLISGEHSNQSLESVLKSLEHTSGIHYKLNLNNNRVLLYKE